LIILNKYVLTRMFDFFAATPELLFIGTLAYALGVSAICSFVGFSAEIGAFFSGVSIASLTYRLQIEQQAEPLKVCPSLPKFLFVLAQ
jgi:Kef-type K+ transport system membrane component KefB